MSCRDSACAWGCSLPTPIGAKPLSLPMLPRCEHESSRDIERAVDVAKRVDARWCTVVPGQYDPGVPGEYQTANVVDNLKRACEICEPARLTMVLEPLNQWSDHAGVFLTGMPQAFQICRAVRSPLVQDPRRSLPPTDHRGESDPRIWTKRGMRSPISRWETIRAGRNRPRARLTM